MLGLAKKDWVSRTSGSTGTIRPGPGGRPDPWVVRQNPAWPNSCDRERFPTRIRPSPMASGILADGWRGVASAKRSQRRCKVMEAT
jgi:hypothetical protein